MVTKSSMPNLRSQSLDSRADELLEQCEVLDDSINIKDVRYKVENSTFLRSPNMNICTQVRMCI